MKRQREAKEARERAITFASVAEDYCQEHLAKLRRGAKDAQEIRRGSSPAGAGARHPASPRRRAGRWSRRSRGRASSRPPTLFWAMPTAMALGDPLAEHALRHHHQPDAGDQPAIAIGKKSPARPRLSDDELAATWRALARMDDPAACCLQLVILTGRRREEAPQLSWKEVDLEGAPHHPAGG